MATSDYTYIDKDGRRIGWMDPDDMEAILEGYYEKRRWAEAFGADFGLHHSTIYRYKNGQVPIPKHVARLVNMLGVIKSKGIPIPEVESPHPLEGCDCMACAERTARKFQPGA